MFRPSYIRSIRVTIIVPLYTYKMLRCRFATLVLALQLKTLVNIVVFTCASHCFYTFLLVPHKVCMHVCVHTANQSPREIHKINSVTK